jgi:hypothetical protein
MIFAFYLSRLVIPVLSVDRVFTNYVVWHEGQRVMSSMLFWIQDRLSVIVLPVDTCVSQFENKIALFTIIASML